MQRFENSFIQDESTTEVKSQEISKYKQWNFGPCGPQRPLEGLNIHDNSEVEGHVTSKQQKQTDILPFSIEIKELKQVKKQIM